MWAVISTSKYLKFYDFQAENFIHVNDIRYVNISELADSNGIARSHDGITEIILDHDLCVSELINAGIPLFIKKSDAREAATSRKLTGFKYLKLEPKMIKI